jgi:hypothetical protein
MRDPRQKFSYKSLFSLFFTIDESGSRILPFFRIKWQNEMWRKIITRCSRKNGTNIRKPECIRIIWFPLTEWAEFRERRHRVGSFALSNPDGSETWIWHQNRGRDDSPESQRQEETRMKFREELYPPSAIEELLIIRWPAIQRKKYLNLKKKLY